MGKKKQDLEQQNEQVEDIMAWGRSKNNYYQQEEQQYSEASEEHDEAKQIYSNQHQNLNQQQFYQLPDQQQPDADIQNYQEFDYQTINQKFIDDQIIWVSQLAKLFQPIKDNNYAFRKKVYDSYLIILMTLKQFKIPYADKHPLVQYMPILKKTLSSFENQLPQLYKKLKNSLTHQNLHTQNKEHQQIQEISQEDSKNKYEASKKFNKNQILENTLRVKKKFGLQIYQNLKMKKQKQKKIKKSKGKLKRQQLPVEGFRTIQEAEARLANQKILKNKGLMKRRSRGDGNSRVKLKYKYQKALIRRRGQGHVGVKQNPGRFYEGQNKVLYGKIASTKLK